MINLKSKTFIIKREIIPRSNEYEILEKYNCVANQIHNACLNRVMKQYNKLRHDRDYQKLQDDYKYAKKHKLDLTELKKAYTKFDQKYGLTEYALHDFVKTIKRHFNLLGIDECQKLATRAFYTYRKYRYGNAKTINYRKHNSDIFIEGKSKKSTCRYLNDVLYLGAKRKFQLAEPDDYQEAALKSKVKYAGVKAETIRGKKRWFAYIVLEGIPPIKKRYPGLSIRKVSLDLGPSIVAIASDRDVNIYSLFENLVPDYKKIRELQRAMDRSRRTTNPLNYNKDGTCKKRSELKAVHASNKWWFYSKRYKRLKAELKEIYRHLRILRSQHHEKLANYILSLGGDIYTEKLNLQSWQKRSKNIVINPKTNKPFSKKRFGKSISNGAPGMLLSIIERKLTYFERKIKKYNTYTVKASQYNHITNDYLSKSLNDRIYTIENVTLQRDMYSAYIGLHINPDLKTINKQSMNIKFNNYLKLQDKAIKDLKNTELKWYVI